MFYDAKWPLIHSSLRNAVKEFEMRRVDLAHAQFPLTVKICMSERS